MIVVVHKKGRSKPKMTVFSDDNLFDKIINSHARKPLIPMNEEILDIGIGNFIDSYKQKHNIKNHTTID